MTNVLAPQVISAATGVAHAYILSGGDLDDEWFEFLAPDGQYYDLNFWLDGQGDGDLQVDLYPTKEVGGGIRTTDTSQFVRLA